MNGVKVSSDFGLIVRKSSLREKNLNIKELFIIMEVDEPFDESENLISFGPHFGEEALKVFLERLESFGLTYFEDFVDFSDAIPNWCHLYVTSFPAVM